MTESSHKITALTPEQAAQVLQAAGGAGATVEATIRADLEAGAPVNGDGTINLIHYAAWLVQELANHGV